MAPCSVGAPHLDFQDQHDEPRRFCASTLFQPLLRARLPVKKVSCAARRHPVSPAQRKKILSSAQEAHFACENAGWRRTLEARPPPPCQGFFLSAAARFPESAFL